MQEKLEQAILYESKKVRKPQQMTSVFDQRSKEIFGKYAHDCLYEKIILNIPCIFGAFALSYTFNNFSPFLPLVTPIWPIESQISKKYS